MADIQLQIEGTAAIAATEALSNLDGITTQYKTVGDTQKDGILATIATIIGIAVGTQELADRLHKWIQKYKHKDEQTLDKVVLIGRNGQRILLINATIEQIKAILDGE